MLIDLSVGIIGCGGKVKEVSLEKLKQYVVEPYKEEDILPLVLFRGTMDIGRAKALLNLVCAFMEAEVLKRRDAIKMSTKGDDINHLCGLHRPVSPIGLDGFVSRLLLCPDVVSRIPHMAEYLAELSQGFYAHPMEPIPRYSIWARRRKWRYPYKGCKPRIINPFKEELRESLRQPLPTFYPFISSKVTEEHDLLLVVHNAVPKGLPAYHRDDICQDLLVAILDGSIRLENLPDEVSRFIKQAYKKFPTKYGPMSLEQPLTKDSDDFTLGDTLHEGNIVRRW